ncbi:uncharacterized protein J4E88_004481 [Alternaria novae-zelandiae]|uniref:uncharacterized protein n=1 Tax=Alternaria novae-zelandiae TaxID=430562 RepID=UPI0020C497CE|nr:uncharacterized protein J4E88_004481 [Alternaria novae-zelandiae]KAI4685038.1 hypothetical protein J4E88_004481 [Alternaria novae-zelandiae]
MTSTLSSAAWEIVPIPSSVALPTPTSCYPNIAPNGLNITGLTGQICQVNVPPNDVNITSCCNSDAEVRILNDCTQWCEADDGNGFFECVNDMAPSAYPFLGGPCVVVSASSTSAMSSSNTGVVSTPSTSQETRTPESTEASPSTTESEEEGAEATETPDVEAAIQHLQEQGFFNVTSSTSSLSNEIAPIFARDRFIGVSENMYDNMKPALQLGSRFVSDERVLQYFWHQMRSTTSPSKTFAADFPPPLIYTSTSQNEHPSVLMADWKEKLSNLASVLTWKVQASNRTPKDMDMALTFAFKDLRTAYTAYATKDRSHNDILELSNWPKIDLETKIRSCMVAWCDDQMGADWRYRPGGLKQTSPSVLLHSFFRNILDPSLKATTPSTSEPAAPPIVQNLGPQFLLAVVLVHELAHCLDKFPDFKCADLRGQTREAFASEEEARVLPSPECGLSWERSVFGERSVRFVQFIADQGKAPMSYTDVSGLAVPKFFHSDDPPAVSSPIFTIGEKTYKATTDFTSYEKALIPWQWISDWFQESHWHPDRTHEQVLALPSLGWKMSYEFPAPDDPPTIADEIVRVRIKVPHDDEQEEMRSN